MNLIKKRHKSVSYRKNNAPRAAEIFSFSIWIFLNKY